MNFIIKRDLVETAESAWTTRVRGSRRLRCVCGGSFSFGSLGGGGRGSILKYSGTSGLGSFFGKLCSLWFSVLGFLRIVFHSFFILFILIENSS